LGYDPSVRVIDCACGTTVTATDDEGLVQEVREHLAEVHDDTGKSDDELREFVSANAYDATDA
jgi:predicted small metal-binding protein